VRGGIFQLRGGRAFAIVAVLGLLAVSGAAKGKEPHHKHPHHKHPHHASHVPRGFIGMMADGPIFDPQVNLGKQFARMQRSGVETLRVAFEWNLAQPYASWRDVPVARRVEFTSGPGGVPTDFRTTDEIVSVAARHHLAVLPVVVTAPSWDATPKRRHVQPAQDGPYGQYLEALVHRYGPHGSFWSANPSVPRRPITMWQVWNEPDLGFFWDDPTHFAPEYVALLRVAHRAIRTADPSAKVVLGSLSAHRAKDLTAIYRITGARRLFDVVASNTYAPDPAGVIGELGALRRVMDRNGDPDKPMVATEVGWPSALGQGTRTFGIETTEAGQARRLASLLPLLASNRKRLGLGGFYYYTWLSTDQQGARSPFVFSGLFAYNAAANRVTAKPAYWAFRRVALALEAHRAHSGAR
jgi:hypothetical protein